MQPSTAKRPNHSLQQTAAAILVSWSSTFSARPPNLNLDAQQVLSQYASRWSIEVTHHDAKQLLGFEDPGNRVPLALQRTAPMAMFLDSLTAFWYSQHGHAHVRFPWRPWYTCKSEASFGDMLTTLRRLTWEEELSRVQPRSGIWNKSVGLLTYLATLAG